jgi:hypothetical protein
MTVMGGSAVERFADQMFYREMLRLREEQRRTMSLRETRPSNVVSFAQYRREQQRVQRRPTDKPPTKPARDGGSDRSA